MKSTSFSTQASSSNQNETTSHISACQLSWSAPISVFVGGLPPRCTQDQLTQFMSQFGYVKEVYISKDQKHGRHKGFAFVNFRHATHIDGLFGSHLIFNKKIEVKRSLQEYLILKRVPPMITEQDILTVFRQLDLRVLQILIGGLTPGVPSGVVAVKLSKFAHQEHIARQGSIAILGFEIQVDLHIPTRKSSVSDVSILSPCFEPQTRQRSSTAMSELFGIEFKNKDSKVYQLELPEPSNFECHGQTEPSSELKTDCFTTIQQGQCASIPNSNSLGSCSNLGVSRGFKATIELDSEMSQAALPCEQGGLISESVFCSAQCSETPSPLLNYQIEMKSSDSPKRDVFISFYAFPGFA